MLLIGCVEPNPGPLTPTKHTDEPRGHHSDSSSSMQKEASGLPNGASSAQSDKDASDLLQYLSSAVQAMTSAITRLEEGQRQLTSAMTQRFASIQHSLDARFHQTGEEQHVLHLDVDELHNKQERLEQENANLRNTVQQLAFKVEELDMEKRKRNLLFFGIPMREGVSCERLVADVLQTDLGITEKHRHGPGPQGGKCNPGDVPVKQKALVLSKARLLTPDKAVSIREDFPEAVRRRRGGLMEYYKQLRKDKKKAILRSDKLFTDNGVFTYDLQQQMIVRLDTPPFRRRQVPVNTRNTTNTLRAPDTANNDSDAMEGVTHADSDADKGQGAAATTKTSGNPPGRRGSVVTHTPTHPPTPVAHAHTLNRHTAQKNVYQGNV